MFKKILVPLDGSLVAERALAPAIGIAQANEVELILVRVAVPAEIIVPAYDTISLGMPEQTVERSRQEAIEYLNTVARKDVPASISLRTVITEGDEAASIVDTAKAEAVDLIVMSTHGRSGVSRWMLGSVTERVLRSAHDPVLVVRSDHAITRVLITLDGSELSEQALEPGIAVARSLAADVFLLRVNQGLRDPDALFVSELERVEPGLGRQYSMGYYHAAEIYLEEVVLCTGMDKSHLETAVLEGPAAQTILDFAARKHIDLIVIATHGRTGLSRWIYGSVTEQVLRATTGAMMIARPVVGLS